MSESPLILIVDDNTQNLQILGNILKNNGYTPAAATSGHEGLSFVAKNKPDLIILDIMMPEIDGIEVCTSLKKNELTKNIPIIFITALTDTKDKIRGFGAGGVDYITKPFVKEEVLMRIDVHIKLKQYMEKLENLTVTDEMTGAYNRRFAFKTLERQIDVSKRDKTNFVICYIDIDHLKIVNDNYGHTEGDRLIKTVVNLLMEEIRSTDYLFRMGGDEFLIIFPGLSLANIEPIFERLEAKLDTYLIKEIPIQFSFGFSSFDARTEVDAESMIREADHKMYENKSAKRRNSQVSQN